MNSEFATLTPDQQAAVTKAVGMAARTNDRATVIVSDREEAYAYPRNRLDFGSGIAWGFNGGADGFCIARGVVKG
jgi:hypothetical protein